MKHPPVLVGNFYGRWTVIAIDEANRRALCRCACGNESSPRFNDLKGGNTRSCGCLIRDKTSARTLKHGMTGAPEYWAWIDMRRRCYDPKNKGFVHYGSRGIEVCLRWRESFANFLSDVGPRPKKIGSGREYSIERLNNDGNYEPGNCKWATAQEQNRNKRGALTMITARGKTQCIADWGREIGIKPHTISKRLQAGATDEEAVGPLKRHRRR